MYAFLIVVQSELFEGVKLIFDGHFYVGTVSCTTWIGLDDGTLFIIRQSESTVNQHRAFREYSLMLFF